MRCSLFIFILLLVGPARATFVASTCANIPSQDFSTVFLEDQVPCSSLSKIAQEFSEIKRFAGQEPPLTLFVQAQSYNSFGTFGRMLVFNNQQKAWGGVRPQSQNEKIWAHEIGHTFFSTWLARDFKAISGFVEYMTASAEIQFRKRDPGFDTSKELASKWRSDFGKARDIQVPYNELFADLVGVLHSNDINAMADAMVAPGMPDTERAKVRFYAFGGKYELSKWDQTEAHFYFAPARTYIGEQFLRFPMTDEKKAAVLKRVYKACLSEIKRYWDSSKSLPSPADGNRTLIHAFSQIE
jgi:hypothetical protein